MFINCCFLASGSDFGGNAGSDSSMSMQATSCKERNAVCKASWN